MKNNHLLFVWEEPFTTRGNICKKLRRFMRIFFATFTQMNFPQFRIKITFRKQIPHNFATRHDIIRINIFRKNIVTVSIVDYTVRD